MSANEKNEYFSDGLTETLLHMLTQVKELKVAARTSSFAFKGKNTDVRQIALALGVAHVLEGSVQRDGDNVRITAQLIRADDGFHVWSENYDRILTDIFSIQDEIASQVGINLLASMLNPTDVTRARGIDTNNFTAYDFYLQAQAEIRKSSFEDLKKAERLLRASLQEDPHFLDAKTLLAELLLAQADTGMTPFGETIPKVLAALDEVLARDPKHAKARILKIMVESSEAMAEGDFSIVDKVMPDMRAIVAEAPTDVQVLLSYSAFASAVGNREEAVEVLQDVLEIDPLNTEIYYYLASAYERTGQPRKARDTIIRALELEPEAVHLWSSLSGIGLKLGDGPLVIDSFLHAQELDSQDHEQPLYIASFLYTIGLPEQAKEFHQQVLVMAPGSEAAQKLELERALAEGNVDLAIVLSRKIIEGYPYERRHAWRIAWRVLLFTTIGRGSAKEDLAFMDAHLPDFLDLEKVEISGRVNTVRVNSFDALRAVKSESELRRYADRIVAHYQQLGYRDEDAPEIRLELLLLFDKVPESIQWALDEVLSGPPTTLQLWRMRFSRAYMTPITDDPRVQEALASWDRQEAEMREAVRNYLVERD